MEYEKEVTGLLKDAFYESWMSEGDWLEFLADLEEQSGVSVQKLCLDIADGIKQGYPVAIQLGLAKELLKRLNT